MKDNLSAEQVELLVHPLFEKPKTGNSIADVYGSGGNRPKVLVGNSPIRK